MIRLGAAAARFVGLLPALVLAALCARTFELALGMPPTGGRGSIVALALALEVLALARALPLLFLLTLPALWSESPRTRFGAVGATWSVLLLAQIVLMQYFLTAGNPLGADLFGYSMAEIRQTLGAGADIRASTIFHLAVPLACLWGALWLLFRKPLQPPARVAFIVLAAGAIAALAAPAQMFVADRAHANAVVLDKGAHFAEDSIAWAFRGPAEAATEAEPAAEPAPAVAPGSAAPKAAAPRKARGAVINGFVPTDARYPFLHRDQTPDVLGPLFREASAPPNLVLVIVEGLGRSFSGPDASHGSFTPFLDDLATRSLYFENFLANQGRTFAALPTILGSMPFGDAGFNAHADTTPLPGHLTLLSILKAQGYHTRFYAGFDLAFDNERPFLDRQGVDSIVDIHDYEEKYPRANSWGYADGDLVARTLAAEQANAPEPSVVVVQTVTMHTPYTFPGQANYKARLEKRLDQLGVAPEDRKPYRELSNIYTSILYADDALRALVDGLGRLPAWRNTILVVTGDHLLPELPMGTRSERYHVPLIIHSPLLRAPARIKSISSQMDLVPSVLAYLAHNYKVRTPEQVTWLGTGLDLEPTFRNVHDIPLKLAKSILADFVQGTSYLSRGQLFTLGDRLTENPSDDAAATARLAQALARFAAANEQATKDLMPPSSAADWVAFREQDRVPAAAPAAAGSTPAAALAVNAVRLPRNARPGALKIEIDFVNPTQAGHEFMPLVVLLSAEGKELTETYGPLQNLAPHQTVTVPVPVKSKDLSAGQYFLAVIPADPETAKPVGAGRYHIPVRLR